MSVDAGFEVASAYVTLLIEDGDFEAQITEKIEAACSVGAANGGDVLTSGLASAAAKSGDEIDSALLEAVAGSGDSMAVEIGGALSSGLAGAASRSGGEIDTALLEAVSGSGDMLAAEIGGGLTTGLVEAASQAGDAAGASAAERFTIEFDTATAGVGADLGDRLAAGVEQVAPHVAQVATGAVGAGFAAGLTDALATSALEAGALSQLTASLGDAAAEAGGSAGIELSRNLSEAAVAALSDEQFAAFTDMLVASATTAGGEAGVAAAESLGASFSSSLVGIDLLAEGLTTAGQAMKAGAQAAAQAAAEEITQVEESTLTGVRAYEAELDAVFQSIWQGGQGMSVRLAAAMTETFQGIEADTTGFTQGELAIFTEFYQALNQLGDQAALDLAERLRLVSEEATSGADLMGSGMSTIGLPATAVKTAAADTEQVASAARDAGGALGGMASTMGGPWLWGILGAVSILPMFSGLLGNSSQAAQQAAKDQIALQQAVQQDSDMIGANTVATITNQLATSGAAATLQGYGISLTTATEAMAGVHSAQQDINSLLNEQIGNLQSLIQEQSAHSQGVNNDIETEKQRIVQLQAARDAMVQLEQDTINAVQHDNELAQATLFAEQAVGVFNVQVRAGVLALQQQAQTAKINADALGAYDMTLTSGSQAYTDAVHNQEIALANNAIQAQINAQALNDSLAPQSQLSDEAVKASLAYQQATTQTNGYTAAINALYGQYAQASGAQAAFTTALDGLHGKITSGTNAVNLNTLAGSKNFTQFNSAATAAESYAEKIYQQTGNTDQATRALQDMAGKLDTAALKANLTKTQVQQLNTELFGVPNIKDITIKLDPTPAEKQMKALDSFISSEINDINAKPITPNLGGGHALSPARAQGGPVQAGQTYIVGEQRPELFVPTQDGYIYPSVDQGRTAADSPGAGVNVHFNYYGTQQPTIEQNASMMRELAVAVGAI